MTQNLVPLPSDVRPTAAVAPRVTAVLVIADPRRANMARMTVNHFYQQTYQNKQILIVNSSGTRLTDREHEMVLEIEVDPIAFPTVGALRNEGIRQASGEWIVPWDDDDNSHPHRLVFQMAHRRENFCVLLSHELRLDVSAAVRNNISVPLLAVAHDPEGIPGTILFPRTFARGNEESWHRPLYDPNAVVGEDVTFLAQFGDQKVIVANGPEWFPGMALHTVYWHGANVKTPAEFFGEFAAAKYRGIVPASILSAEADVSERLLDYVKWALDLYGIEMEIRPLKPTPGDAAKSGS